MLPRFESSLTRSDRPVQGVTGLLAMGLITLLLAVALALVSLSIYSGEAWGHWYFEGYNPKVFSETHP